MRQAAELGLPLIVRTVTMRSVIVVLTAGTSALGAVSLAAFQLGLSLWLLLALALDATAVAAQTVVGNLLGANAGDQARKATWRMTVWGAVSGTLCALVLLATQPLLVPILTADDAVGSALAHTLPLIAVLQPLAGVVYVLDGVLIGAGDNWYLAAGGALTALLVIPAAVFLTRLAPGTSTVWAVFGLFLLVRVLLLGSRARGVQWIRLGVD
jgi:Na+-driven multidrug efflux pump